MALMFENLRITWLEFKKNKVPLAEVAIFNGSHDLTVMRGLETLGIVRCSRPADEANPFTRWSLTQTGVDEVHSCICVQPGV